MMKTVIDLAGAALAPALIDLRCTADPASGRRARDRRRRPAAAAGGWRRLSRAGQRGGLATPEDIRRIVNAAALTSPVRIRQRAWRSHPTPIWPRSA
jgi:dihydroorotase